MAVELTLIVKHISALIDKLRRKLYLLVSQ